jgi:hypothetical protein
MTLSLALKSVVIIMLASAIALVVLARRAPAEGLDCLHSPQAVREASPGAWPSWRRVDGGRCWYAKGHKHAKEVMPLVRQVLNGSDSRHETKPRSFSVAAGAVPLPRPRRESVITPHLSYEEEGAITNQLMFGTVSNRIDEAFEVVKGR